MWAGLGGGLHSAARARGLEIRGLGLGLQLGDHGIVGLVVLHGVRHEGVEVIAGREDSRGVVRGGRGPEGAVLGHEGTGPGRAVPANQPVSALALVRRGRQVLINRTSC